MVYDIIPPQLNNPTKRFKYARLEKNLHFANLETALDWLSAAGVSICSTRVGSFDFPLGLSEDRESLKLFMNDVGLLTSQLMGNVDLELINNHTNINYGSIYENYVAQELYAQGYTPHYYLNKKRGEVDFVVEDTTSGKVLPLEIKSGKDYKRHSALSNVLKDKLADYGLILHNGNVESAKSRDYLPIYAAGLILELNI